MGRVAGRDVVTAGRRCGVRAVVVVAVRVRGVVVPDGMVCTEGCVIVGAGAGRVGGAGVLPVAAAVRVAVCAGVVVVVAVVAGVAVVVVAVAVGAPAAVVVAALMWVAATVLGDEVGPKLSAAVVLAAAASRVVFGVAWGGPKPTLSGKVVPVPFAPDVAVLVFAVAVTVAVRAAVAAIVAPAGAAVDVAGTGGVGVGVFVTLARVVAPVWLAHATCAPVLGESPARVLKYTLPLLNRQHPEG